MNHDLSARRHSNHRTGKGQTERQVKSKYRPFISLWETSILVDYTKRVNHGRSSCQGNIFSFRRTGRL